MTRARFTVCRASPGRKVHAQRFRAARRGAGERGRRARLRHTGRGEPRRRRGAAHLDDRARHHPPRAGGGLHGGNVRAADRASRRLPDDARAGRAQPDDRRRLRAPRRHADGDDHRPEADPQRQAGAVPDRRHRHDDAAADEIEPSDRCRRLDPHAGARSLPDRRGGAPGSGPPGTAGGRRRRDRRCGDRAVASHRPAGRRPRRHRARGRDDPRGQATPRDARRGGEPAAPRRRVVRLHPAHRPLFLQHADGQGRRDRRVRSLHGHRGAKRARLRARCHRSRRPRLGDRPRHDREAAVPDGHGRRRSEGHPHRLHRGRCRTGLPSRRGSRRRYRHNRQRARRTVGGPHRNRQGHARAARVDPPAHQRSRGGGSVSGHAAATGARCPRGDAGDRHRLPRQRHVQDLVCPQLSHARRQYAAARQRAGDDGRRAAVGDHGEDRRSIAPRSRGLRRRRLHDEQPGAGDGNSFEARPGRADPRRFRLRDDPLETEPSTASPITG